MIVAVIEASALVVALVDDGCDGDAARARLLGEDLAAPDLIYLEILSVLRRECAAGRMPRRRAELAIADLAALPIEVAHHASLVNRCWELRDNLTSYDAAYVALAEALGATLLTADTRLARSPALPCEVEILG